METVPGAAMSYSSSTQFTSPCLLVRTLTARSVFALSIACLTSLLASVSGAQSAAQSAPPLSVNDRTRLAEAFHIAAAVGDSLWAGWSRAPFAVLLVTPEHEYLIRHVTPTKEFVRIGFDTLLKSDVHVRPRVFDTGLLATFPAVGGVPTIVIGQPEQTMLSSTAWVLTVLHEHFHQLQYSQPTYYSGVNALGLARGDQSGMWMLNFPFAYDSAAVQTRFATYTAALLRALSASDDSLRAASRSVSLARDSLRQMLGRDDNTYLAFQLWQEGVARYTELKIARLAAGVAPTAAFRALSDFRPYAAQAERLEAGIRNQLTTRRLQGARRELFYPVGAAEALLLDRTLPKWRDFYFTRQFSLTSLSPNPAR